MGSKVLGSALLLATVACGTPATNPQTGNRETGITPLRHTDAVAHDPDDPALWIHPGDPARSLILGTDKIEREGALYVFGVDGKLRQRIAPLDRPNNVDVEYGVALRQGTLDVAVLTERMQHRLRMFAIPSDGGALVDLAPAGLPILAGQHGQAAEPMGIALYKRPRDGTLFAIVSPKTGDRTDYLWQYRIDDHGGTLSATLVRRFGAFSRVGPSADQTGEIEAVAVDDELGFVYYSDERFGIRKYGADPDATDPHRELALLGRDGYLGDREGLAIFVTGRGTGFIVSSDQLPGGTRVRLFRREGTPANPHDHSEVRTIPTVSDSTDGLEVSHLPLPGFPHGVLVMMNAGPRNFLLYSWDAIEPARSQ